MSTSGLGWWPAGSTVPRVGRARSVAGGVDQQIVVVRYRDKSYGKAFQHTISRHTYRKSQPKTTEPQPLRLNRPGMSGDSTSADHHEQFRRDERIGHQPLSIDDDLHPPVNSTIRVRRCRQYPTAAIPLGIHPGLWRGGGPQPPGVWTSLPTTPGGHASSPFAAADGSRQLRRPLEQARPRRIVVVGLTKISLWPCCRLSQKSSRFPAQT